MIIILKAAAFWLLLCLVHLAVALVFEWFQDQD